MAAEDYFDISFEDALAMDIPLHPGSDEFYNLGKSLFLRGAYESMPSVTRQRPGPPKAINASKPKPSGKPKPSPKKSEPSLKNSYTFKQHYPDGLNARGATTIVNYGPSGVGKTSIWAHLPKVGYIYDPKDEGVVDLVKFSQCPLPVWMEEAKDFEHVFDLLGNVADQRYDISHLIIDSLTGFEHFCFQYHCREYYDNDWSKEGFMSFNSGPKNAAKTDWPRFLDALDDVRRSGISVIAIAHSQIKTFKNPDGEDFDQHKPYLDNETWQQTHRWAKAVVFYNIEIGVEKKKGGRAKAKIGSEERAMYTDIGPTFIAKNRWGIAPRIDCGVSAEEAYNAFMSAYMEAGK